jgi:hypothetical protein
MNDHASPAIRLHDVVVVHEQSGAQWRAGLARIRDGRIVVAAKAPPGFFDSAAATFRIEALDGANRVRRFPNLVLLTRTQKEYVFD